MIVGTKMEVIKEIKEVQDGYEILTTEQKIILNIDTGTHCCERVGYFFCNDNVQEFIGACISQVSLTNTALQTQIMERERVYENECMFVNLVTNKGVLQFVAYNQQNGYYGHRARVECHQLTHSIML